MSVDADSDSSLYALIGQRTTTTVCLVYEMITESSNLATNILIDLVGVAQVTAIT